MEGKKRSRSERGDKPGSKDASAKRKTAEQHAAKVDPVLKEQLSRLASDDEPIEAVCALRAQGHGESALAPEEAERLAREVLRRVEKEVGVAPDRVNVFRNLSSLIVSARPSFVRALLKQREIVSAMANVQPKHLKH